MLDNARHHTLEIIQLGDASSNAQDLNYSLVNILTEHVLLSVRWELMQIYTVKNVCQFVQVQSMILMPINKIGYVFKNVLYLFMLIQ